MEELEREISLSQIWFVVKKAFFRAIIAILIGVILVGTVLVIFNTTNKRSYSSSTIVVGGDIDDATLTKMQYNKASVVNKALAEFKGGTQIAMSNEIQQNLSINAEYKRVRMDDKEILVPASFVLTLSNVDLSNEERNELLSIISKNMLNIFAVSSLKDVAVLFNLDSQLDVNEYYTIVRHLETINQNIYANISSSVGVKASIVNFVGTSVNKSFAQIMANVDLYKNQLGILKQYIILNNVQNKDMLKSVLEFDEKEAGYNETKYNEMCTTISDALTNYKPVTITIEGGTPIYTTNNDYNEIVTKLNYYKDLAASAKKEKESINSYITTITTKPLGGATEKQHVKDELSRIFNSMNGNLSDYKKLVEEYNSVAYNSTGSIIKAPARTITVSPISTKLLVISLVAIVLVVYLVVFANTFSKCKKNGFSKETTKVEEK